MYTYRIGQGIFFLCLFFFGFSSFAHADLTLTSGSNATTTPNVATSITGFQIVGPSASTTPVKIHVTSGTVHVPTVSGVTMSGNDTATLNLSGTVSNLNTALSSLTYTRSSTGTDTLEVALVNSDQIYFSDNNHVYQYVPGSITWNNAKTAAEALTAYGSSGYLVTITSAAENNFVKARLSGDAWIGASDVTSEGDWKWVTGPEAGTSFWLGTGGGSTVGGNYASWGGGEPNDSGGNEDCGEEYVASGSWNDLPCTGTNISGYVAEFGSNSAPVTVVSKNVSIVTADVPAVISLSPSNGATLVGVNDNLVIGFSKTVTKQTGNILIKKSSDDSTFETIDAAGSLLSGSGTSSITINPSGTLLEGTGYYVTIPNTAFKDASNNYFDGITGSTTWAFTTSDLTAPTFTNIGTSSLATTTASITWTTNEAASSKVIYSANTSYASSTSETDTSSRVTSHSKSLSSLLACTSYNFKVISADASGNYATSTSASFITTGCSGGATPSSTTSSNITVNTTGSSSVTDTGRTLAVTTPANFTATSSSIIIQIKGLSADTVLDSIGKPTTTLSSAASIVFDVTALIDNTTTLDSFDTPVSISYTYTDADVAGLDEASLSMYHYHNGAWLKLDNCSVDTRNNKITCDTPSFSTFAIFGSAASSSKSSTTSVQERVRNLLLFGKVTEANALKAQWPALFPTAQAATTQTKVVRDLTLGISGEDVLQLQKILNATGFTIASKGVGSSGNESNYFGSLTRNALLKYQKANGITPASGYFGAKTRAVMKTKKVTGVWW